MILTVASEGNNANSSTGTSTIDTTGLRMIAAEVADKPVQNPSCKAI